MPRNNLGGTILVVDKGCTRRPGIGPNSPSFTPARAAHEPRPQPPIRPQPRPTLPPAASSIPQGSGLSWLFPFVDGAPPIGWHDAAAYLVLPVLLVVSQFASQKIVSPQSNDPAQQQTQAILKFIPFMIGWFSLNVPSGLTLYWLVNNVISTGQQVYMKRTTKARRGRVI